MLLRFWYLGQQLYNAEHNEMEPIALVGFATLQVITQRVDDTKHIQAQKT